MISHSESLCLQMSTIWADTVDQARATARDFVFAGLSEKRDLYGLHDCVYNYESVLVRSISNESKARKHRDELYRSCLTEPGSL
jgi:hypothetical protein